MNYVDRLRDFKKEAVIYYTDPQEALGWKLVMTFFFAFFVGLGIAFVVLLAVLIVTGFIEEPYITGPIVLAILAIIGPVVYIDYRSKKAVR